MTFQAYRAPLSDPRARAAMQQLDQRAFANRLEPLDYCQQTHGHLWMDGIELNVGEVYGRTLWVVPTVVDIFVPSGWSTRKPVGCSHHSPFICPSYAFSPEYVRDYETLPRWVPYMGASYLDFDVAPVAGGWHPFDAAQIPTCALTVPRGLDEGYLDHLGKVSRKSMRRVLRDFQEQYTVRPASLDDLFLFLDSTNEIRRGRDEDGTFEQEINFDTQHRYEIESLRFLQGMAGTNLQVQGAYDRADVLRSVNVLLHKTQDYGAGLASCYCDDYLAWRYADDRFSFGTAWFLYNLDRLAPGTVYNISADPGFQPYKRKLVPEHLALTGPGFSSFNTEFAVADVGFAPPYYLQGNLVRAV